MKTFACISRLLPLALMLSLGLVMQAFVMSHHGHAAGSGNTGDYQTIIICSDGEFREILIDANGDPVDGTGGVPHCPFCLAAEKLFLQASDLAYGFSLDITREQLLPAASYREKVSREPDTLNCLDPPYFT
ncbi:MAG: hypothetical protein AAGA76_07500 [Pseudomonadota bacterium]